MLTEEAKDTVETFFRLHEERVRVYKRLDSGHRRLLLTSSDATESAAALPAYQAEVAAATEGFSSVSKRVLALLTRMRGEPSAAECTAAVQRIQDLEREKLHLTCEMHLLAFQVHQHPEDAVKEHTLRQRRKHHADIIDAINECIQELRCELYD